MSKNAKPVKKWVKDRNGGKSMGWVCSKCGEGCVSGGSPGSPYSPVLTCDCDSEWYDFAPR